MSWLVTSIANSLKLDDDDDPKTTNAAASTTPTTTGENHPSEALNPNNHSDQAIHSHPIDSSPRGVKDDLSEFSKTLTRQFWGVASFLAPPPQISDRDHQTDESDPNSDDPAGIEGIRSDLSEIGGKFRTGISKLSSNKAVTEFTKIASNILQFASQEDLSVEDYARRGVVGVTDEVVAFARDVSMHPETWLDFPLPDDDEEEDFDLSDAQQEHALAVECLAPELAALRTELCLGYMTEGSFWKIYFVLLHPRLTRNDAGILSTPQIMRARAMLTQDLHNRNKSRPYGSRSGNSSVVTTDLSRELHVSVPVIDQSESIPIEISVAKPASSVEADVEMDKHLVTSTEIAVIDKAVVEEVPKKQTDSGRSAPNTSKSGDKAAVEEVPKKQMDISSATLSTSTSADQKDEDDTDDWLKEESNEGGSFRGASYPLENDDDVSFSDLEEDDDVPTSYKKPGNPNSSTKEASDWVQLSSQSADSAKDVNTVNTDRSNKVSSQSPENKESNDWLDIENIDVA